MAVRVCEYRTATRIIDTSRIFPGRGCSSVRNPTQGHRYSVKPEACSAVTSLVAPLVARRLKADALSSHTSGKDKLVTVPWWI